jgi:hypothetical protein
MALVKRRMAAGCKRSCWRRKHEKENQRRRSAHAAGIAAYGGATAAGVAASKNAAKSIAKRGENGAAARSRGAAQRS